MSSAVINLQNVIAGLPNYRNEQPFSFQLLAGEVIALQGNDTINQKHFTNILSKSLPLLKGSIDYEWPSAFNLPSWQKPIVDVQLRHQFKGLDHEKKLYYQQRYHASDADNSDTVSHYLKSVNSLSSKPHWTYEKVIGEFQIEPLLSKELIKLSNGETRKVLIAEALLKNPAVLILTQPFAGLDEKSRIFLNSLMVKIKDSGINIIFSHNEQLLPSAITHVAIFNKLEPIIKKERTLYKTQEIAPTNLYLDQALVSSLVDAKNNYQYLVKMDDVNISYNGHSILKNISWEIKPGERWSLTGENGAGKSTLLSLLNGDNPQAYANNIILFDKPKGSGESIWDLKRKIGFISPELYQYFPQNLTCLEVLFTGINDTFQVNQNHNAEIEENARHWLSLFDITEWAEYKFHDLPDSIQRLSLIARALIKKPLLLILDEPFQGFSQEEKQRFKTIINELCRHSSLSLIFVSHYKDEIPEVVTQHLKLKNGQEV